MRFLRRRRATTRLHHLSRKYHGHVGAPRARSAVSSALRARNGGGTSRAAARSGGGGGLFSHRAPARAGAGGGFFWRSMSSAGGVLGIGLTEGLLSAPADIDGAFAAIAESPD